MKLFSDNSQTELTEKKNNAILFLNNRDVRKKYIGEVSKIASLDNPMLPDETRARIMFEAREQARLKAREIMADFKERENLDKQYPAKSFENFVQYIMDKKGMKKEDVYHYTIGSATRTNAKVNKKLKVGK